MRVVPAELGASAQTCTKTPASSGSTSSCTWTQMYLYHRESQSLVHHQSCDHLCHLLLSPWTFKCVGRGICYQGRLLPMNIGIHHNRACSGEQGSIWNSHPLVGWTFRFCVAIPFIPVGKYDSPASHVLPLSRSRVVLKDMRCVQLPTSCSATNIAERGLSAMTVMPSCAVFWHFTQLPILID